jgi:ABC-type dipeptide/oligopeptide/nickel transport systems, permease components
MLKFIVRRLLLLIPILLGLTLLLFIFIHLLPGDPALAILGERATPQNYARVRAALGLDQPLYAQYLGYMGGILHFDLGHSFITNRDVVNDFLQRFPATLELSIAAMIFAVSVGIPLGMWSAKHHGTWMDGLGTVGSLIGISIPIFFLGLMLKYVFAIQLHILPDSGRLDLATYGSIPRVTNFLLIDTLLAGSLGGFWSAVRHLILPALALGTIPLAIIMRITRASVVEVLNEDYVRTARAKGLPGRVVDGRHVLRNALLPVVTVIGIADRSALRWRHPDRDDLRLGWGGALAVRCHDHARLPGHPERHPDAGADLRAGQPGGGRQLRPAQPTHPLFIDR